MMQKMMPTPGQPDPRLLVEAEPRIMRAKLPYGLQPAEAKANAKVKTAKKKPRKKASK